MFSNKKEKDNNRKRTIPFNFFLLSIFTLAALITSIYFIFSESGISGQNKSMKIIEDLKTKVVFLKDEIEKNELMIDQLSDNYLILEKELRKLSYKKPEERIYKIKNYDNLIETVRRLKLKQKKITDIDEENDYKHGFQISWIIIILLSGIFSIILLVAILKKNNSKNDYKKESIQY